MSDNIQARLVEVLEKLENSVNEDYYRGWKNVLYAHYRDQGDPVRLYHWSTKREPQYRWLAEAFQNVPLLGGWLASNADYWNGVYDAGEWLMEERNPLPKELRGEVSKEEL